MKKLYRFDCDFGRMGSLTGLFVADHEDIAGIIGETVYFGEVLGKHSEIVAELSADDFSVVTDDQDFVTKFEKYNCDSGYNPLDYFDRSEEDEDE